MLRTTRFALLIILLITLSGCFPARKALSLISYGSPEKQESVPVFGQTDEIVFRTVSKPNPSLDKAINIRVCETVNSSALIDDPRESNFIETRPICTNESEELPENIPVLIELNQISGLLIRPSIYHTVLKLKTKKVLVSAFSSVQY